MILKLMMVITLFMAVFISSIAVQAADKHKQGVEIHRVSPYRIARDIRDIKGKKRAIVLYASWCPNCVQKMPQIIDIERARAGSIIAISVDESRQDFTRYMNKLDDVPFKAIVIDGPEWKLAKELKRFDVEVWEAIPHIILLDENNKTVEQGNFSTKYIAGFLGIPLS
ncbi:MAG: hypothetical protein COB36_01810 [Alphaproteobacteria bacterium]|nr:MAG: hypothetical protein COB36_01810 [Alphaproteobacteria bacterium]